MFIFAILVGVYAYSIFFLGIFHQLHRESISLVTAIFLFIFLAGVYKKVRLLELRKISLINSNNVSTYIVLLLIATQAFINFIGALGPEYAFDALWYHLTFPKIYLMQGSITYLPGTVFYYATMPKLTEMLYVAAIALHSEIVAKVIHFIFGVLTVASLYYCSQTCFTKNRFVSVLAGLIFYSNLVVAWESTTAYIDLARTFYEFLALWAFLYWAKGTTQRWLFISALMIGFAISIKLLSLGSLVLFTILILYHAFTTNLSYRQTLTSILVYWFIALLIPLPWFIFSFLTTGNIVYPFFSAAYETGVGLQLLSPLQFFHDMTKVLLFADDPLSPIYILMLPLTFIAWKRFSTSQKLVTLYAGVALLLWYVTPRTGGGRFILPYLPAMSLVATFVYMIYAKTYHRRVFFVALVIFIGSTTILYRGYTNSKYIPYILGQESKSAFLAKRLNFSFGDFYDIDGYFQKNITSNDTVLLYGFHNMYYVDFPFIHGEWLKENSTYTHVATQHADLPPQFKGWKKVYENETTGVKLYKQ